MSVVTVVTVRTPQDNEPRSREQCLRCIMIQYSRRHADRRTAKGGEQKEEYSSLSSCEGMYTMLTAWTSSKKSERRVEKETAWKYFSKYSMVHTLPKIFRHFTVRRERHKYLGDQGIRGPGDQGYTAVQIVRVQGLPFVSCRKTRHNTHAPLPARREPPPRSWTRPN